MKVVALRKAKQELSATVDESQDEDVLITRHGKPAAVMVGVEGHDIEDVMLMSNPRFWEMIEASRSQKKRLSLSDVRKRLKARSKNRSSAKPRKKASSARDPKK
ncbi:MAG: type II toxin-antitoxin system Phd/YefM family antitoxin [Deltaproteobacteria bacterium]|nr:type II toxin-antitoxin system Phd/YefM family antitoxin [Deltaproteobacteria bacterium]